MGSYSFDNNYNNQIDPNSINENPNHQHQIPASSININEIPIPEENSNNINENQNINNLNFTETSNPLNKFGQGGQENEKEKIRKASCDVNLFEPEKTTEDQK